MLCFCRLEIEYIGGHKTLEWVPLDPVQWLTGFIHVWHCTCVTIRTLHVLPDWLLAVF